MAITKVVEKNAEIDGKPIKWYVLAITSYLCGDYQTLEIKLTKTEALMGNMLLNNTENKPEQNTRKATNGEKEDYNRGIEKKQTTLLDDDEGTGLFD